ncbi:MAG: helix-turn-helix transcriptional regulator [Agathobacter sp.]|nr:helix-turn-helix transcriptional regulator [Agathobacter sp.]
MISYAPFWKTMEEKGITQYKLIYHYQISANTLQRIKRSQSINTNTLNLLCLILDCKVSDIIEFEKTEEEMEYLLQKDAEMENRKKSNASFRNLSKKN